MMKHEIKTIHFLFSFSKARQWILSKVYFQIICFNNSNDYLDLFLKVLALIKEIINFIRSFKLTGNNGWLWYHPFNKINFNIIKNR